MINNYELSLFYWYYYIHVSHLALQVSGYHARNKFRIERNPLSLNSRFSTRSAVDNAMQAMLTYTNRHDYTGPRSSVSLSYMKL